MKEVHQDGSLKYSETQRLENGLPQRATVDSNGDSINDRTGTLTYDANDNVLTETWDLSSTDGLDTIIARGVVRPCHAFASATDPTLKTTMEKFKRAGVSWPLRHPKKPTKWSQENFL
ncbi:hypothetical protein [Ruegeria atlantica]|uniref:hypothetical protein n=1 Tax=Ruegeria atlantica TaxID=81569 RepID=UPI00147D2693|nr:hypothetical protein [Ruegeria atlantica]